jgi:uncharacterized protein (TIGR01244 family)
MDIRRLTDTVSVGPQIDPDDVSALAQQGFVSVINNRPDGEMPGQPAGDAIAQAAAHAGLAYRAIPVAGSFPEPAIAAFEAALEEADGPVLAFCRSGMRCTCLWALASARTLPVSEIIQIAASAGYDIAGLAPQIEARSGA